MTPIFEISSIVTKQVLNCQVLAQMMAPKIHYQFGDKTLEININNYYQTNEAKPQSKNMMHFCCRTL